MAESLWSSVTGLIFGMFETGHWFQVCTPEEGNYKVLRPKHKNWSEAMAGRGMCNLSRDSGREPFPDAGRGADREYYGQGGRK